MSSLDSQVNTPGPEESQWPWFAVRVRSNFEKRVAVYLRGLGLEEFAPVYTTRTVWSDRIKIVERPLFPGYVLCRFDPENWLPILKAPGVVDVVKTASHPAPIDASEVASVRTLVRSGVPAQPHEFLKIGQKVLIRHGPLAGVEGILQAFRSRYRIIVSINLLQQGVAAEVDAAWVR